MVYLYSGLVIYFLIGLFIYLSLEFFGFVDAELKEDPEYKHIIESKFLIVITKLSTMLYCMFVWLPVVIRSIKEMNKRK